MRNNDIDYINELDCRAVIAQRWKQEDRPVWRERSGMCRGGGGNKIRLCTKGGKIQSALHFFLNKVISKNILSFPHVVFFPCILNPHHAKNT